jgi:hypothetical protein
VSTRHLLSPVLADEAPPALYLYRLPLPKEGYPVRYTPISSVSSTEHWGAVVPAVQRGSCCDDGICCVLYRLLYRHFVPAIQRRRMLGLRRRGCTGCFQDAGTVLAAAFPAFVRM